MSKSLGGFAVIRAAIIGIIAVIAAVVMGYIALNGIKGKSITEILHVQKKFNISSIMYSEDRPTAIVNKSMVHEGDSIEGAKVLKIYRDKIEFTKKGRTWTQKLTPITGVKTNTNTDVPTMIQFTNPSRCPPCRMMEPVIKKITSQYSGKFRIKIINPDDHIELARKFGITAIPTQIFCDGSEKELSRHVGYATEEEIISQWSGIGYKF